MSSWSRIFGKLKAIATAISNETEQVTQSARVNKLAATLSSEDVLLGDETRSAAAIGLVKIGRSAVPDLVKILDHPWDKVRLIAARALADIADPATFDMFIALASNKKRESALRSAAILGLGNIGDKRALDLLVQIAEDYKVDYHDPMRAALAALGQIGGERARDVLQKTVKRDSGYSKQLASDVLKKHFGVLTKQELEKQLWIAAENGKAKEVEKLLALGVDINSRHDTEGSSALYDAAGAGHEETVSLLISKGGDVNVGNYKKFTPLHIASLKGSRGIVKKLLDAGADIDARTLEGETPLYCAADHGHQEIAEMLLAKGAGIDLSCNIGRTPLYMACLRNKQDVAQLLISKGANVNAKALDGLTPLERAIKHNNTVLADTLRQHGAVS